MLVLVLWIAGMVIWQTPDAFRELWNQGVTNTNWQGYQARSNLNMAIRIGGGVLFAMALLALGSVASSSIASEREQDTWISLLATSLDGGDIIRGKMLGPLRMVAPLFLLIFGLYAMGLTTGAIHPVGFALATVGLVLFTWFVLAMATYFSLISSTSWRAQAGTLGVLILPHFCCMFPSPIYLSSFALMSYPELQIRTLAGPSFKRVPRSFRYS